MLSVAFYLHCAECHYAECRYAECRYAECHYAECRCVIRIHYFKTTKLSQDTDTTTLCIMAEHCFAECHIQELYAECRYAE